jgi:hypothetical protein
MPHVMNLTRAAAAEATGTALLLAIVVGSGIMSKKPAGGALDRSAART